MTQQLPLFAEPVTGLTCSFKEPWLGAHPLCEAESRRLEAAFLAGVAAGTWDVHGYTKKDRKRQQRKKACE